MSKLDRPNRLGIGIAIIRDDDEENREYISEKEINELTSPCILCRLRAEQW